MNIIFMRHGEATDNVKKIISDKEIYWSILTDDGKKSVLEAINKLTITVEKIYVSPFPRTLETAHYAYNKFPNAEVFIEDRIREISYGKYSGQLNNEELDNTRHKQVEGDYFICFGDYGENRFDIETRLCEFLKDIYDSNQEDKTIMIVSHGSITSYMKRILNIKTSHIKTGEIEIFKDVNFTFLFENIKKLKAEEFKNKFV
ncbi:MAG: phosphoglycerate mutase family protein [Bacilli bacterium]|nr:phosphoglycerate mutase family protein [Bacilli bacterium]